MALSPVQPRTPVHLRQTVFNGYHREDGLWDIEARLLDEKAYDMLRRDRGLIPAGIPVHGMTIRVTVDDSLTIVEISSIMEHTPFDECQQGVDPMQQMVGISMGPGWRHAVDRLLGRNRGCTHLRELLFNMATVAYQTIPNYREHLRRQAGEPALDHGGKPPHHLGKCIGWDFDGPVVKRHFPEFAGWQPLRRLDGPGSRPESQDQG